MQDVSGGSDHPALSRIAGSTIVIYERKDQAEIRIPLERIIFDLQTQKFNAFKTISASGRLTRILYALPDGKTPEETEGYYENCVAPSQWRGPLFRCAGSARQWQ
jgi:hypothetical protein